MNKKGSLEDIVSLAKRRGFIYPSSEIYGGLAGVFDYGPLGVRLKHNIQNLWWSSFVSGWDDMYPMDTAILMNKKVWEASGHASGFNDPMVECNNCKSRLRADHLRSDKCPVCGKEGTLSEPKQFNMMFKTTTGPVEGSTDLGANSPAAIIDEFSRGRVVNATEANTTYLRPETAQGMFVNFKNVVDSFYPDMPFGMAQVGKAFRNEISPRDFLFRLREMEQMEIEYFVAPELWQEKFNAFRDGMKKFFTMVGLPESMVHELEVSEEDRAHYSARTIDFEFEFPFGRKELAGLAYRTDYDLKKHQEVSGRSMVYMPKGGGAGFIPHVIEPSFGVERLFLAVLSAAYTHDEVNGEERMYLKLPKDVAPIKVAVFPLLKNKPELIEKANQVYDVLKKEIGEVMFDDNGNIGKRYRRQDEIGTPQTVTIDFQSLEDDTVTVRNRDTTEQKRMKIAELANSVN
ncbi:glycine--tRNA ligase [Candidatus Saccharibacteria bacterium]|nr:glycine--tRNA ligase [Candidatus Saccharibacteria bacterium]